MVHPTCNHSVSCSLLLNKLGVVVEYRMSFWKKDIVNLAGNCINLLNV